jgi:hypothetical protein
MKVSINAKPIEIFIQDDERKTTNKQYYMDKKW